MGAPDDPRTPEGDAVLRGQPELVRVGRRNGWRPAVLAVGVVAVLLAAAVWKPWEGVPSAAEATATIPPGAAGELLPAITSEPDPTATPSPSSRPTSPTFAGFDLAIGGTVDPHAAWGVAVAYVSRAQFDDATLRGSQTVTPSVNWKSIAPGTVEPGPTLDRIDVTSVAFAPTWPIGTRATTIWLVSFGPPRPNPSLAPSPSSPAGSPVTSRKPIAAWFRVHAGDSPGSLLTSGAFFLRSPAPPGTATDWPGHGWPPDTYAFEILLESGARVTLPFTLGGSTRS